MAIGKTITHSDQVEYVQNLKIVGRTKTTKAEGMFVGGHWWPRERIENWEEAKSIALIQAVKKRQKR